MLLIQCLKNWIKLPIIQRQQRKHEYRREQLRQCVKDIVPDFNPHI